MSRARQILFAVMLFGWGFCAGAAVITFLVEKESGFHAVVGKVDVLEYVNDGRESYINLELLTERGERLFFKDYRCNVDYIVKVGQRVKIWFNDYDDLAIWENNQMIKIWHRLMGIGLLDRDKQ